MGIFMDVWLADLIEATEVVAASAEPRAQIGTAFADTSTTSPGPLDVASPKLYATLARHGGGEPLSPEARAGRVL